MDNLFKEAAEYHIHLARQAVRAGNSQAARKAYSIAVRAWRKAVEVHPSLINYLLSAEREYLRFVRADGGSRDVPDQGGFSDLVLRLRQKLPFNRHRIERRLPAPPSA